MIHRVLAAFLLAAAFFFGPAIASAGPNEPAAVTRARQLYQQGVTAFDKSEFTEAERLLRESYQMHPHPVTLRNLAAALERLDRRADACNELARLVRVHPTAEERSNAERTLANLSQRVGRIDMQVSVTGADIKVDDKWAGVSPLPTWYVEPGEHTVSASKTGFKDGSTTVNVGANDAKSVSLTLVATEAPGMPGAGLGTGADPTENGTDEGVPPKTIALIAGGAVTLIGLGVGIGFMLDASSAESDAEDLRKRAIAEVGPGGCAGSSAAVCRDLQDANDHADSSGTLSTVGFIGAGVAGAATIAIYFLWPEEKRQSTVRVAPSIGRRDAGLSILGRF